MVEINVVGRSTGDLSFRHPYSPVNRFTAKLNPGIILSFLDFKVKRELPCAIDPVALHLDEMYTG